MSEEYKDRFSEATKEQGEKSAFVCETCNQKYSRNVAKQKKMTCCERTMKELAQESFGP